MKNYQIKYTTDNGFTDTVIVAAANTIMAWDMFDALDIENIVSADIIEVD